MNAQAELPRGQIDLQQAVAFAPLPEQDDLARWVGLALAAHPGETRDELTVRFVEESESRALNRDYRGKDAATNVLSFPFEAPLGLELALLGDLVISPHVVEREALEQGKPLAHHFAHMVIHGVLHLLGHDHIENDEAERMETLERELLARLSIPDPYRDDA